MFPRSLLWLSASLSAKAISLLLNLLFNCLHVILMDGLTGALITMNTLVEWLKSRTCVG